MFLPRQQNLCPDNAYWPDRQGHGTAVAIQTFQCYATTMDYTIDRMSPEDEGDGLPNMHLRLRAIFGSMIGSWVVWAAVISLIWVSFG